MSGTHPNKYAVAALAALLSGLLPILAAHGAYLLNIFQGSELAAGYACMPYLEGCVSISRAARSGPGLFLFRWVMLVSVPMLLLTWLFVQRWLAALDTRNDRRARAMAAMGFVGALFLVFYVTALGSEGEWYQLQRRYGVTIYFGGTALAQLLLVGTLWPMRRSVLEGRYRTVLLFTVLVCLQWALGVASVFKRLVLDDPVLIDQIENVIEWWYALAMSLAFAAIAALLKFRRLEKARANLIYIECAYSTSRSLHANGSAANGFSQRN
jgi:hypothetical protein